MSGAEALATLKREMAEDYAYEANEMFNLGMAYAREQLARKYDEQARSASLQGFERLAHAATNTAYAIRHMRLW